MAPGITYPVTDNQRAIVQALTAFGHTHRAISQYLKIDPNTLTKYFRDELDRGKLDLELLCGMYLIDCVKDKKMEPKYRIDCAKYFLSRKCDWHEKIDKTGDDDKEAFKIREGVKALAKAFGKDDPTVNKDVNNDNGTSAAS